MLNISYSPGEQPAEAMKMTTPQISLFRNEEVLCEFLILISLPSRISRQVSRMKKEFAKEFGPYHSQHSVPHLTVCSFLVLDSRSDDALALFRQRIEPLPPFKMQTNGFGFFEEGRVVHVQLEPSEHFDFISSELNRSRQELRIRKNYTSSNTPHITIARDLDRPVFEAAKDRFATLSYSEWFEVHELTVLEYDFEDRKYRNHSRIKLKG